MAYSSKPTSVLEDSILCWTRRQSHSVGIFRSSVVFTSNKSKALRALVFHYVSRFVTSRRRTTRAVKNSTFRSLRELVMLVPPFPSIPSFPSEDFAGLSKSFDNMTRKIYERDITSRHDRSINHNKYIPTVRIDFFYATRVYS